MARLIIGILLPAGAVRASRLDRTAPLYRSTTTQLRPGTVESPRNFIWTTNDPFLSFGGRMRASLAPGSRILAMATASSILTVEAGLAAAGALEGSPRVMVGGTVTRSKND